MALAFRRGRVGCGAGEIPCNEDWVEGTRLGARLYRMLFACSSKCPVRQACKAAAMFCAGGLEVPDLAAALPVVGTLPDVTTGLEMVTPLFTDTVKKGKYKPE